MVKVGVVGLGVMGQHHARVYSQLECEFVGVVDADMDKARTVGEHYGVPYYAITENWCLGSMLSASWFPRVCIGR